MCSIPEMFIQIAGMVFLGSCALVPGVFVAAWVKLVFLD